MFEIDLMNFLRQKVSLAQNRIFYGRVPIGTEFPFMIVSIQGITNILGIPVNEKRIQFQLRGKTEKILLDIYKELDGLFARGSTKQIGSYLIPLSTLDTGPFTTFDTELELSELNVFYRFIVKEVQ